MEQSRHQAKHWVNYQLNFWKKLKNLFELRNQKRSADGPLKKKTSEHI